MNLTASRDCGDDDCLRSFGFRWITIQRGALVWDRPPTPFEVCDHPGLVVWLSEGYIMPPSEQCSSCVRQRALCSSLFVFSSWTSVGPGPLATSREPPSKRGLLPHVWCPLFSKVRQNLVAFLLDLQLLEHDGFPNNNFVSLEDQPLTLQILGITGKVSTFLRPNNKGTMVPAWICFGHGYQLRTDASLLWMDEDDNLRSME